MEQDHFLGLWIDGKHVAGEEGTWCVGVTEKGRKKVLGFTQATTEHSGPIKELFRDLIERWLRFEDGLLCVVDGGRGLRKAIHDIFGRYAQVQRCQWLWARRRRELPAEGQPTEVAKEAPARL